MTSHISSVMGFLTTSLHKNCQNDVKLLETWQFWPILGKVERAEVTCDPIKKSCSTFLIKFWLYKKIKKEKKKENYFDPIVYYFALLHILTRFFSIATWCEVLHTVEVVYFPPLFTLLLHERKSRGADFSI